MKNHQLDLPCHSSLQQPSDISPLYRLSSDIQSQTLYTSGPTLGNHAILDMTKLKANTDNKFNNAQMKISVLGRVEYITCYLHFLFNYPLPINWRGNTGFTMSVRPSFDLSLCADILFPCSNLESLCA